MPALFHLVVACAVSSDDTGTAQPRPDSGVPVLSSRPDPVAGEGPWSLVLVPAGESDLGCTEGQRDCRERETVTHVTLTHALLLSQFEVTRGQWREVMGQDPLDQVPECDDCPVGLIAWNEAAYFLNEISRLEGLEPCYYCSLDDAGEPTCWSHLDPFGNDLDPYACPGYRLPTEAEWEFSARCGSDTMFAGGDLTEDVAWELATSQGAPHPVGRLTPNACGLYDMSGNAFEWNHDWFVPYREAELVDPVGPLQGTDRNVRGGSWKWAWSSSRVSYRDSCRRQEMSFDDVGLRVARTAPD